MERANESVAMLMDEQDAIFDREIFELKAKLYDMMVSRKEVIHSDEEG